METNDSNLKPQPTGGLKLMTVFIAVLALHVVVIGGFTVYHLMSGGSTDADLTLDKNHKSLKIAPDGSVVTDSTLPDTTLGDKNISASAPAPTAEVASGPAGSSPSPADQPVPTDVTTLTPAPTPVVPAASPTPTGSTTTPTTSPDLTPPPIVPETTPVPSLGNPALTTTTTTTGPAPVPAIPTPSPAPTTSAAPIQPGFVSSAPSLAPPPEPVVAPNPAPAQTPTYVGPVKMPPVVAETAKPAPVHHQIYTVKITDSYKKIAHAHHITVAELKEANHIKGNVLHTGQKLIIPTTDREVATTESATSLDSAPTGPVFDNSVPASTAVLATSSTSTVVPMSIHHHLYTVVKGDTLTKIAHRFKTTATALMEANNITDPTKLSIGKKLRIPSQESRSAKNSEPAIDRPSPVQTKSSTSTAQLANFAP